MALTAPKVRAVGTVASGTGTISPGLPSGTVRGDLLYMIAESQGAGSALTASGWTSLFSIVQGNTRVTVLFKRAAGSDATTTNDTGDHQLARIVGIEKGTFHPVALVNTSAEGKQEATKSLSIPGLTTTLEECLVLACSAASLPDASSTSEFGAATNATLESLTERIDNAVTAGDGSAIYCASGVMKVAGEVAATTLTAATSAERASAAIAVSPFYLPITDDFNDNVINPAIWDTTAGATETSEQMRVTCASSYNYVATPFLYTLENKRFIVRVPTLPASHFSLETYMSLQTINGDEAQEWLRFGTTNGVLYLSQRDNYESDDDFSVSYNSTTHKWWAIRIQEGTVYWEGSSDGIEWTVLRELEATVSLEVAARCKLISGYWGSPGALSPNYAAFDDWTVEDLEEEGPPPPPPTALYLFDGEAWNPKFPRDHAGNKKEIHAIGGTLKSARIAIATSLTDAITKPDDYVILHWWETERIAKARELGSKILIYQNLTRAQTPDEGRYGTALTLAEAEGIGADSEEVDGDAGTICHTNTGGYAALALSKIKARLESVEADGVFLDDMNPWNEELQGGDNNQTEEEWNTELAACNAVVGPGLQAAGFLAVANMGGTVGQANTYSEGWLEEQFAHFSGGVDEFWTTWPEGNNLPEGYVVEAAEVMARQTAEGKLYFACINGTTAQIEFGTALAMLQAQGGNAAVFATPAGPDYGKQSFPTVLEEALALGRALDGMRNYERRYTAGEVSADIASRVGAI